MAEAAERAELDGAFGAWVPAAAVDPLALLVAADEQEMAQARARAQLLAGVGGLQLAYGLLMPDTPALASLRTAVDATGLGPLIRGMVPLMLTPSGVPYALAAHVRGLLDEHAQHGLLTPPGSQHPTAEAYMEAWLGHLRTAAASVAPLHAPGPDRRDVPDATGEASGAAANGGPAAGRGE